MKLAEIPKSSPLPPDFPAVLRALADRVERGEIAAFVGAFSDGERFEFLYPSSLNNSLLLASLLQGRTVAKFGVLHP